MLLLPCLLAAAATGVAPVPMQGAEGGRGRGLVGVSHEGSLAATTTSTNRGGAACATASDCGLLGACDAGGRCACDTGFTGATCMLPDLGPARPPAENALFSPTSHSWGGLPIRNPDGKSWSLFAAEMTQHCPLSKFNNNSAIRRAVSPSPGGPFRGPFQTKMKVHSLVLACSSSHAVLPARPSAAARTRAG